MRNLRLQAGQCWTDPKNPHWPRIVLRFVSRYEDDHAVVWCPPGPDADERTIPVRSFKEWIRRTGATESGEK